MRFLSKCLLAVFLVTLSGLAGTASIEAASQREKIFTLVAQTQIKTVSAVLPPSTEVMLKSNGSKFGKLFAIDPKEEKLTLALQNGRSESISISRIEKIVFRNVNPITGKPLGPIQGEKRTWFGIPLANLRVQSNGNRLEVKLSEVDAQVCQKPRTSCTVEDLSFSPQNKVSLNISVLK